MIPLPNSNKIIEELNEINKRQDIEPYLFKLNRFKKEAQKMLEKDPIDANIILGFVAQILGDIESMHKHHRISVQLSNGSSYSHFQYASSLVNAEKVEEAYLHFLKAHQLMPADPRCLYSLMAVCYNLHKDEEYEIFKEKLRKLNIKFIDPDDFFEDDEKALEGMITNIEAIIKNNPQLVVKPDPELIMEIEDLIDGVEVP